ncbi:SpoIIE family protein phosphatase [Tunicatimonas pelagia]|uniref:SpoIIE family protein phosphatase n=1 Tax=Tunicatimonas pelagia TaxID=931531 RepID=UPI002665E16B|nr:SpoIIE family protein phosphatase [Tunicatimonas pelagia]WKN40858.1 tetratricopeptide repeat protein [Tunicatimonas pelagia]
MTAKSYIRVELTSDIQVMRTKLIQWGFLLVSTGWMSLSFAQVPTADSLNIILERANSLEEESEVWLKLAAFYEQYDLDTTYYLLQRARGAAQKANYNDGLADTYVRLASYFAHYLRHNSDSLQHYLNRGIAIYWEEADSAQVASAYQLMAQATFSSDYYSMAVQYADSARLIYEQQGNRLALAEVLLLLCEIRNRTGSNVLALDYCIKASTLFTNLQVEKHKARLNQTIGIINHDVQNYAKAREYLLQATEFAQRDQDTSALSSAYIGMGRVHVETENYDLALESFRRVISLNQDRENVKLARAYYHIGRTYLLQNQSKEAIPLLEEALVLAERFEHRSLQARCMLELSNAYYALDDMEQCFNYLNLGLAQTPRNAIGSNEILREYYKQLAKYYAKIGDFENALVNYGLYDLERNLAFQEEIAERFAEMETFYETARKDNQIELLQQENQIQSELASVRELTNVLLIVGLLLMGGVGALLYSKYVLKTRANQKLEEKKQEIEQQRDEITVKNKLLEENSRDIRDSIEYARRIQLSLLSEKDELKHLFPDSFVFHRPKDIVSGDFYWIYETVDTVLIAVLDCTGHGVPGAFMTVLANSVLNQIVHESKVLAPNTILSMMDTRIQEALRQTDVEGTNADGLDIAICMINRRTQEVCYSGAQMPLYFTHNGKLSKLEPSRYFIGGGWVTDKYFTNQCQQLQRGDMLYMASDGYQDQFGGPNDKKFMRGRFCDLLTSIQPLPTPEQYQQVEGTFNRWQGEQIQTDDVLLMGIRL